MKDIKKVLVEKAAELEPVLLNYAKVGDRKTRRMISHPIKAGGKRIRPFMVLTACEAVGGDSRKILSAAASVELLHTFTLVHDDIMDHDLQRRGKPTVHALWGEEMAIVVGDTLYSTAFKALVDVRKRGIPSDKVLNALEVLVWANSQIQEGQILDMSFSGRNNVTEREYMDMVRKKTGVLLEASLKIGAILGGGDVKEINALGGFGRFIGIAFQIQDDLLDLTSDEDRLGKPFASDIKEGKRSLIVVHALYKLKGIDRRRLVEMLKLGGKITDEETREAIDLLYSSGSMDYAKNIVHELTMKAKKNLHSLKKSDAIETLNALSDFLIKRNF